MTNTPIRLAVLASGSGSNFEAIASHFKDSTAVDVALCVSNKPSAGVLARAQSYDIPTALVDTSESISYSSSLLQLLEQHDVSHVALAGYLKLIPDEVIARYRNKILNIHPSLLPAFGGKGMYGRRVHEAVIASGTQWSGATVHFVDETYDTGLIIMQEPVPVSADDDPASLAARILKVEHRLYPSVIELLADNRIDIIDNRVQIKERD